MEKPGSASGAGAASTVYNTVFIDTNLDTHLAMIVSDSDTVSDLKKRILYEHPLCFPNIGKIKIDALKVKRKGHLYHLSDFMFVKSAFHGVSKCWFLSVDASRCEERCENDNSRKAGTGDIVACVDIRTNNSSADMVNLLLDGPSKKLSNIDDSSLPHDADNHHAKQNSASQQFDVGNSAKENSRDLRMEVDHAADSNSKGSFPATDKEERPNVQDKDVGDNMVGEDAPASVSASVLKEKQNVRKRKKDVFHDHAVKEIGASAVESGKEALESDKVNERSMVLNDTNLGNQISFDETFKTVSSDRNKKSVSGKRAADKGAEVPGEHSEHQLSKHKDVSLSEQESKLTENSSRPEPASKKKRKSEKKDGNKDSLVENGGLISDLVKPGSGPDITTSEHSLGQKLGSKSAISDQFNTESAKASGRRKSKRQKTNPSQVGSEITSAKDVKGDTNQAIEAINHKNLGCEADQANVLEAVSEPHRISSKEMQEVSSTNRVPHSGGDDDMADTNEDNTESKAPESGFVSVMKTGDSVDLNASCLDSRPTIVSQEEINPQNSLGVSGHENQSGKSESKSVEPKKSSKKIKQSKKTKPPIGGTKALEAEADPDVASITKTRDSIDQNSDHVGTHPTLVSQEGVNLPNGVGASGDENKNVTLGDEIVEPKKSSRKTKKPKGTKDAVGGTEALDARLGTSVTGDHLSDNAEQDGTTPGKEASKLKTTELLPSVTDKRADDVIRDVLDSLQQGNNSPANTENMEKKSRKKTKKKTTVAHAPELQGKDDVDHGDPTAPSDNVSEMSASSKSTRKTKVVNSTSAAKSNRSGLESKNKSGVEISPVHTQLDSSQNTLKASSVGMPIQNVANHDHPKNTGMLDVNNSIEAPCESERIKSQHQNEIVDSGEILLDKVTDKTEEVTEVKGKKKKKPDAQSGGTATGLLSKKPDVQSGGTAIGLLSPQILNGNQHKNAKAQAAKSSSIQSQRSSSKVERHITNVQSSKTRLTGSESAAKEHLQSKKSDKANATKEAHSSIGINSSGSTIERSKSTIILNKGGNEGRSHLNVSKASGSSNGKVLNSLENKKSLLAKAGTIFKHDDKESSDDEDGGANSDDSTRTPSDNLSSDDDSETNISSSRNGSYKSEVEEGDGRNRKEPGSSSPKRLSLQAILRSSSSYKKAKLSASQSPDDLDSQLEEFVPDSQAK